MLGSLRSPRAPPALAIIRDLQQQHPNRSPLPPPAPVARALLSSGLCPWLCLDNYSFWFFSFG